MGEGEEEGEAEGGRGREGVGGRQRDKAGGRESERKEEKEGEECRGMLMCMEGRAREKKRLRRSANS
jgi:hypothetical protein